MRRRIETGYWKVGEQISTIDELEREFEVGRVTVRQAIDLLQEEGLIRRRQGKGTFVNKQVEEERWLKLDVSMHSMLDLLGKNKPKFRVPQSTVMPPRLRPEDGKPAENYVYLESVQSRNRKPYSIVKVHLAEWVYLLDKESFDHEITLGVLPRLKELKIKKAHQTLVISAADTETAHLLELELNAPTAEVLCVVTDETDTAVYVADIIYRGDCIKFDMQILPDIA